MPLAMEPESELELKRELQIEFELKLLQLLFLLVVRAYRNPTEALGCRAVRTLTTRVNCWPSIAADQHGQQLNAMQYVGWFGG